MADPDIDELANKYGGGSNEATSSGVNIDALATKYGAPSPQVAPVEPVKEKVRTGIGALERFPGMVPGIAKGALNVGNTLNQGAMNVADTIDRLLKNPQRNLGERTQENIDKVNKLYKEKFGDQVGSGVGEVVGEVAASAPLIPAGAVAKMMKTGFGALPTTTGVGASVVTKAAPLVNRLGASVATGSVIGGEFGALTSAASPDDFSEHVGKNIVAGGVGAPVVGAGIAAASSVSPFIRKVLNNVAINGYANANGMSPWAVKNILTELENAGYNVPEARLVLKKLGPRATLGDLDAALQQEVGGIAQRGGRPTSIVKNRYGYRAETANDDAQKIMETKLGPKPDVVIEKGKILGDEAKAIQDQAQRLTHNDYEAAKKSTQKLSTYSLIGDINTQLEGAVGKEASALKEAKGYLYKTTKDPLTGKDVQSIKTSAADLHKVRRGLDDMIDDRSDSLPSNALSAIKNVRDKVDEQLKTIPEMLAADTKYAEKMKLKEGLQIGYEALTSGNHQTFKKVFDNASPELQETIRKGLRAAIGDHMQRAAKGELAGAQQLFKAKNDTREKLKLAFGSAGEEVLDALTKQATLRATEALVATGSRTEANRRINAKYDVSTGQGGIIKESLKGLAIDAASGAPLPATAIMGAKRAGGNIVDRIRQRRMDINAENSADILSRSGQDLHNTLNVLEKVDKIQNAISHGKLPVTKYGRAVGNYAKENKLLLSAPIGEPTFEKGKEVGKIGGKIGKHWINQLSNFVEGL